MAIHNFMEEGRSLMAGVDRPKGMRSVIRFITKMLMYLFTARVDAGR